MLTYNDSRYTAVTLNGTAEAANADKEIFVGDLNTADYTSSAVTVTAAEGANYGNSIYIEGNACSQSFMPLNNNCIIDPKTGTNKLYFGNSANTIVCNVNENANNFIYQFSTDNDKIQLLNYNNELIEYSLDNSDFIITVGNSKIYLRSIFTLQSEVRINITEFGSGKYISSCAYNEYGPTALEIDDDFATNPAPSKKGFEIYDVTDNIITLIPDEQVIKLSVAEANQLSTEDEEFFMASYEEVSAIEDRTVKYFYWLSIPEVYIPDNFSYGKLEFTMGDNDQNVEVFVNGKPMEVVQETGSDVDYWAKLTEFGAVWIICD